MQLVINWPGRAAETLDWPGNFTHGEMRLIKAITKLRPSEMADAIDADDPDIIVSFASVALRRAHPELSDKEIGAELDALEFAGGIDVIADPVGQSPPSRRGRSATKKEPTSGNGSTSGTRETLATDGA